MVEIAVGVRPVEETTRGVIHSQVEPATVPTWTQLRSCQCNGLVRHFPVGVKPFRIHGHRPDPALAVAPRYLLGRLPRFFVRLLVSERELLGRDVLPCLFISLPTEGLHIVGQRLPDPTSEASLSQPRDAFQPQQTTHVEKPSSGGPAERLEVQVGRVGHTEISRNPGERFHGFSTTEKVTFREFVMRFSPRQ